MTLAGPPDLILPDLYNQSPDQILAGPPGQPDWLGLLVDTPIWTMKGQYPHSQIGLP